MLQEDRLVFSRLRLERLLSPGIPVDRIVRVLQQIGAGFVDQAIGFARRVPDGRPTSVSFKYHSPTGTGYPFPKY